jgi:nitrogen-specific signal transduction histidine kinase
MKSRSAVFLVVIVLVPWMVLVWMSVLIAENEKSKSQSQIRDLMRGRLQDVDRVIRRHFGSIERSLQKLTEIDGINVDQLRQTVRTEPRVLQFFVLSSDGALLYPDPTQPMNSNEQGFLLSTSKMFVGQDLLHAILLEEDRSEAEIAPKQAADSSTHSIAKQQSYRVNHGWFVWYWDRGLNLIYWQRRPSGQIVGLALERGRWIADLIAELPDTDVLGSDSDGLIDMRIRLSNGASDSVYQWGHYEADSGEEPICEIPVSQPLQSWRLQCFVPKSRLNVSNAGTVLAMFSGVTAFGIALSAMAWSLYRDYSKKIEEASQQVSFVNQVSHELKTPLTNILLYADLLERDLEKIVDNDHPSHTRVDVIQSESQRLGRLIGNVLTLARQKRKTLQPHYQFLSPDDLIGQILERFRPSLETMSIKTETIVNASAKVWIDPDFTEQIMGNLINNVEKYAAEGGKLRVMSQQDGVLLRIIVEDAGPGIVPSRRDDIFRPFHRETRNLSASSGTGIGLSIARELARLHGGDISLQDSHVGCRFEILLKTDVAPTKKQGDSSS